MDSRKLEERREYYGGAYSPTYDAFDVMFNLPDPATVQTPAIQIPQRDNRAGGFVYRMFRKGGGMRYWWTVEPREIMVAGREVSFGSLSQANRDAIRTAQMQNPPPAEFDPTASYAISTNRIRVYGTQAMTVRFERVMVTHTYVGWVEEGQITNPMTLPAIEGDFSWEEMEWIGQESVDRFGGRDAYAEAGQ